MKNVFPEESGLQLVKSTFIIVDTCIPVLLPVFTQEKSFYISDSGPFFTFQEFSEAVVITDE